MRTLDSIESRSTPRLSLCFWKISPMRAFLPIFAVLAAALFSTEAASGQGTDRYTKMANQLVELINAGDYAGIQTNFNKNMDTALPLDKSSEFFKGLTQQVGKIQKLGEPQDYGEAMVFPAKFEKDTLDMQIALDSRGLIAGLEFKPRAATKKQNSRSAPDPSAQLSPFTKVRYDGDTVNVTYDGVEYQLAAMDNLSTADMLEFCRKHYGKLWQKRFAEDLVAVWKDMGHPINAEHTVNLTLVDAKTGEEKTVKGAIMSNENRALVRHALSASTNALPANP